MAKHVISSKLHDPNANNKKAIFTKMSIAYLFYFFLDFQPVNKQNKKRERSAKPAPTDKSNSGRRCQNYFFYKNGFNSGQYHCPHPELYFTFFQQSQRKPFFCCVQYEITPVDYQ